MQIIKMKNGRVKVLKIGSVPAPADLAVLERELGDCRSFSEVLIDLTETDLISDAFAAFLRRFRDENPRLNGKLRLINPNELVMKVLEYKNLNNAFEIQHIYPTAW